MPVEADNSIKEESKRLHIDTSLTQSPPPVTDSAIPAGAITTPPDSANVSSDEEMVRKSQKQDKEDMKELEQAVRSSLQIDRKGSPDLDPSYQFPPPADGNDTQASEAVPKLTPAARKISHSRSTTDTAIAFTPPQQESPANGSTSDGSDGDSERPPLIRKKSGELVKPAIRPKNRRTFSSMPGTPTYGKKGVHFNDDIQQVKHFLQVDRPIAVSVGGSPAEDYEEDREFPFGRQAPSPTLSGFDIRLGNFPRESLERQSQPVRLEKVSMSADKKCLLGQAVVANLAFHKAVVARFTFDFWKTTSEVLGEYCSDPLFKPQAGYDLFKFTIRLSDTANIENKTMFICMRYNVNGQDYWDNNNSMNYQVDFTKRQGSNASAPGLGTRPIPKSRKNSIAPNKPMHGESSFEEDLASGLEKGPALKLKNPARNGGTSDPQRSNRSSQQFGTRYDFGASLTAALTQAQSALGDRSGVNRTQQQQSSPTITGSAEPPKSSITRRHSPPPGVKHETPRPDALHANQTSRDSRAYQDFVSKFCFFGSAKSQTNAPSQSTGPQQPTKQPPAPGTDGTVEEKPPVPSRSANHSLPRHDTPALRSSTAEDQSAPPPDFRPRTGSPPFGTPTYDSRSSSPASIGYRFGQTFDHGLIPSGAATPATAIHG